MSWSIVEKLGALHLVEAGQVGGEIRGVDSAFVRRFEELITQ
jgi:hypothetical protein